MANCWLIFLQKYHNDHPELSYREAMKAAVEPYRESKKQAGGSIIDLVPKSKKTISMAMTKGPSSFGVQESIKRKQKGGCGSCAMTQGPSSLGVRRTRKQKGGNPLAAIGAVAEAAGALQGTVQKGIDALDSQLERGFEKRKITGTYDRKAAHNARAVLDRRLRKAKKYEKKYGIPFDQAVQMIIKEGGGKKTKLVMKTR